ncbi:MAG: hypothetical protein KGV59_07365 [Tenacibaculum sp.]|nr:hypothetical protein [Tenacibaculum sp.]
MEIKTYGLNAVRTAEPQESGDFPTSGLEELCRTYKNSGEFIEEEPTITPEECDQVDDPIFELVEKGKKYVKFSIFDYSPETLKALKGGTVLDGKWYEPTSVEEITKAVEIETKTGLKFQFPKARIIAKFNAKLVKNGLSLLEVIVRPLSPAPNKPSVIIGK